MKHLVAILLMVLSASIAGCGGGASSAPLSSSNPYPSISGNWSLSGTSQVGNWIAGGQITNLDGAVSGTIHMLNSSCFNIETDIPFAGTITKAGAVSLTSSPIVKQVISVTGTMTSSNLAGAYTIAGGCADGDKGMATGFVVPAFTNTYTGTFLSQSGVSVPVKMSTTQTPSADIDGVYQVSGTASFTSQCFSVGTISQSAVAGGYIFVVITTDKNGVVQFVGNVADSSGNTITGQYYVSQGVCAGDQGSGSVSRP